MFGAPLGSRIVVPFTGLFSGWISHGSFVFCLIRTLDNTNGSERRGIPVEMEQ